MPITLRAAVLITVLLLVAPLAALAQQSCRPPAQPAIDWMGTQTGCRPGGAPCAVFEVINFKALPVEGSFQSCDGFAWNFGDPANGSASVQNPPYAYGSPGKFTVGVGVFNPQGNTSASKAINLTVQPFAEEFKATPPRVAAGLSTVLSWVTKSVKKVHIDPLNLDFPPNSTASVQPSHTTVYTLTPFGDAGQGAVKSVTVEVFQSRHRAVRHR